MKVEKKVYICEFCKRAHETLDDYMKCVSDCGTKWIKQREEEKNKKYLEEMNATLNAVKQAKKYYEEKLEEFKTKYPKEYEINFTENCGSECKCHEKTEPYVNPNKAPDWTTKSNSLEFSYENNGKDKPTMSAKVNGKEVKNNALKTLLNDPDTRHIAKLLGIV